jgi:hypothetical protein
VAIATEKATAFNPLIHNEENQPEGLSRMNSDTLSLLTNDRFFINDPKHNLNKKARIFTLNRR